MKKTSKHNQLLKAVAQKEGLGISTIKRIDRKLSNNQGDLTTLINKSKAYSEKMIYAQDLIVPNNAMLLQLLKHNWNRYKEDASANGITYTKEIKLKHDYYKESIRVVSSEIEPLSQKGEKVLFSGLTIEDLYIISGIYTIITKAPETAKYRDFGECFKVKTKSLFKILNPGVRWDMSSAECKKEFVLKIAKTLQKCVNIQANYWLNHKLQIHSIRPKIEDGNFDDSPEEKDLGLIFKRVFVTPEKDGYFIQVNQNGLLNQAAEQNRLVTINKDWLQFGRNTSNHDLIKFYISYRIQLAANSHNKMKSEINIKNMQWQIGKTDKAYIRKYMQNLKDMHILKDFELTRLKITWTMQTEKDIDIIQVKDENKELVEKEKTQEIIELEKRLTQVNAFNAKHEVTLENKVLNTRLHAVFSRNSYEMGGRLYTDGDNGYQGVTAADRANIRIDGKPTIELDFSAYHAHLLYNLRGLNTTEDPYNFHPSRKAAKLAFNIALNAKNRDSAIGAFKRAWTDNGGTTPEADICTSAERLFDLCRAKHETIADSFCNDRGLTLQNIDSKIALKIVEDLQKKRIVCLPMHDSFIVKAEYKDVLTETMQKVYRQFTGFECPIK